MAQLITTLGPKSAGDLGLILPYEHIFVDLRPWNQPGYAQAEVADVIDLMSPEVAQAQAMGVTGIVECSTVGLGHRLLLSHDRGWYDPAQPGGGTPRPYTYICEHFLPKLRAAGTGSVSEVHAITLEPSSKYGRRWFDKGVFEMG
jgi:predicted metal-dependent phosphotriesterase family hydrolase